jgi:hypothetical protein
VESEGDEFVVSFELVMAGFTLELETPLMVSVTSTDVEPVAIWIAGGRGGGGPGTKGCISSSGGSRESSDSR